MVSNLFINKIFSFEKKIKKNHYTCGILFFDKSSKLKKSNYFKTGEVDNFFLILENKNKAKIKHKWEKIEKENVDKKC